MKKRGKRIRLLGICAVLMAECLVLPACGSGDERTSGSAIQTEKETGDGQAEETARENGALTDDEIAETDSIAPMDVMAAPETKTFTITAVGDCTLGKTQDHSYEGSFYAYYDSYGADYFFENVRSLFCEDDMTVVNLECVLSTSDDRVEKTFNLRGKPEYVNIMTGSSVEACSLGNNHSYDYGETGFQETRQVLEDAGITYAYTQQEGIYTTESGVKVGMVSSSLLSQSAERTDTIKSQIRKMREDGAEVVIACCHWGIEREYYPTDYQKTTAHDLIDAGADLVIGHHPHVLQGVEAYKGKLILYSLGNFCFGGNKNPSDKKTMIFQQTFTLENGTPATDSMDARIIPCRLSSSTGHNDFQPAIVSGEEKQGILDLVNEYSAPFGEVSFDPEGILHVGEGP